MLRTISYMNIILTQPETTWDEGTLIPGYRVFVDGDITAVANGLHPGPIQTLGA